MFIKQAWGFTVPGLFYDYTHKKEVSMIVEREDNSGLYFIVGGLLVAVVVFSIYYFNTRDNTASVSDTATVSAPAQPAAGNSMSLSVDNNGVKATTETK